MEDPWERRWVIPADPDGDLAEAAGDVEDSEIARILEIRQNAVVSKVIAEWDPEKMGPGEKGILE